MMTNHGCPISSAKCIFEFLEGKKGKNIYFTNNILQGTWKSKKYIAELDKYGFVINIISFGDTCILKTSLVLLQCLFTANVHNVHSSNPFMAFFLSLDYRSDILVSFLEKSSLSGLS